MSQLAANRVRAAVFPGQMGVNFISILTGGTPVNNKGVDCDWEIALFKSDTELYNVASIIDLTFLLKPQGTPGGATEILKTLTLADINQGLDISTWFADGGQHACIALTASDLTIAAGLHDVTIYGHVNAGSGSRIIVFGQTVLSVVDRGITAITNPAIVADYPTRAELNAALSAYNPWVLRPGGTITIQDDHGGQCVLRCVDGVFTVDNQPTS